MLNQPLILRQPFQQKNLRGDDCIFGRVYSYSDSQKRLQFLSHIPDYMLFHDTLLGIPNNSYISIILHLYNHSAEGSPIQDPEGRGSIWLALTHLFYYCSIALRSIEIMHLVAYACPFIHLSVYLSENPSLTISGYAFPHNLLGTFCPKFYFVMEPPPPHFIFCFQSLPPPQEHK